MFCYFFRNSLRIPEARVRGARKVRGYPYFINAILIHDKCTSTIGCIHYKQPTDNDGQYHIVKWT